MARRVSWTNNSSGHSGTYVYRAPTLDPQNLPAPVATVDPVAQGATAEWIDSEELAAGDYDYAAQDFDGQAAGDVSAIVSHQVGDDYSTAQAGDEIGGGIYAGTITYADSRQFHIVFATQSGEGSGLSWGNETVDTGATDLDDGAANQALVLGSYDDGNQEAFYHCRDYVDGDGNNDYYLPARNEIAMEENLRGHPELSTSTSDPRWSSSENTTNAAWRRAFNGGEATSFKSYTLLVRPIRRVAV